MIFVFKEHLFFVKQKETFTTSVVEKHKIDFCLHIILHLIATKATNLAHCMP